MLILVLIDVQYLRNVVFSFEKGLNGQIYSSSDSHYLIKKLPPAKILNPLMPFGIPCLDSSVVEH